MSSTTAPQPQVGTSTSPINDCEEVDIGIIVGEEDGLRLRKLLKQNQLKVVRIDSKVKSCRHRESRNKLKTEVIKLQEMLASRSRALEVANDEMERMQRRFKEADEGSKIFQEKFANQQAAFEEFVVERNDEMKNLTERTKEMESKLQKSEDSVETLWFDLNQALAEIERQKADREEVFKEKGNLEAKFQEERRRRSNQIIALKNENESLTEEKINFTVFLRQLIRSSNFPVLHEGDVLTPGDLKLLNDHIEKLMKTSVENQRELMWSRNFIIQLKGLLNSRWSSSPSPSEPINTAPINDNQTTPNDLGQVDPNDPTPSESNNNMSPSNPPHLPSPSSPTPLTSPPEQLTLQNDISYQQFPENEEGSPKNEIGCSEEGGRTPSMTIPLSNSQEQKSTSSPPQPPPDHQSKSSRPQQRQQSRSSRPRRANPKRSGQQGEPLKTARKYKQCTEFAVTAERHGFHSNPAKLSCLCGKEYATVIGLRVHVQKMTKEWRYKCHSCNQYFFFRSDLKKHHSTTICGGEFFDLDEFLQMPPQERPKRQKSTSYSAKATKRAKLRKLQYWSREWKFQCEHCPQKFFSFSQLKNHLKHSHKIVDALKEFSIGCHLCGEMFRNRREFFSHRKLIHNLHRPWKRRTGQVSLLALAPPPVNPVKTFDLSSDDDESGAGAEQHPSTSSAGPSSSPSQKRKRIDSSPKKRDPDPGCECRKKFKSKRHLKHHLNRMKNGKGLRCLLCVKNFKEMDVLKAHVNSFHNEVFKGFRCAFCDKPLETLEDFAMHRERVIREHEQQNGEETE